MTSIRGYWGRVDSFEIFARRDDPKVPPEIRIRWWINTLLTYLPANPDFVRSHVFHFQHHIAPQFPVAQLPCQDDLSVLLARVIAAKQPKLAEEVIQLQQPGFRFDYSGKWFPRLLSSLSGCGELKPLLNARFVRTMAECSALPEFQVVCNQLESLLLANLEFVVGGAARGGLQTVWCLEPLIVKHKLWDTVVIGICTLDVSEQKRELWTYCRNKCDVISARCCYLICGTNDVQFAKEMLPWSSLTLETQNHMLRAALHRVWWDGNDQMLQFLFEEKKWSRFTTQRSKLLLQHMDDFLRHPIGESILKHSQFSLDQFDTRHLFRTPETLEFVLQRVDGAPIKQKNLMIQKLVVNCSLFRNASLKREMHDVFTRYGHNVVL
jgi:hypothetical protein